MVQLLALWNMNWVVGLLVYSQFEIVNGKIIIVIVQLALEILIKLLILIFRGV